MSYLEEQLARTRMSDGHHLSREQIERHGRDRYPSAEAQARKLLDEVGELLIEVGAAGQLTDGPTAALANEYADVGLALHALGDKLGLDLIACMRELVENDNRDFREKRAERA